MRRKIFIQTNIHAFVDSEQPFPGVTIRSCNSTENEHLDLQDVLYFSLTISTSISTGVLANWIYDRLKKKVPQKKRKSAYLRISSTSTDVEDLHSIQKALEIELSSTLEEQE
jgi:6-pyruvoyl-tetrahydropterin synthase